MLKSVARKWLDRWERDRVFEADPDSSRPKFFITAAFMYPNSPAHMGHGRTYLVADVLARFWRMRGYDVLFPMGFHYTGTPILAMAERVASGDRSFIEVLVKRFDVPPNLIEKMKDPLFMARYFHEESKRVFKEYGLSIDWRREFTTIDPEFRKFIHWQFKKLKDMGFIVQGSHPVGWCPKHQMPVGAHDTQGDKEPDIGEFVAIEFSDGELRYPTATLRPETVFGVTNLWVNPRERYCVIELENSGKKWVVGEKACERLQYQLRFKVVECFEGSELVGRVVRNPVTGEKVPVLPAEFVDTSFATGVVMSVPAHAPYDAAALLDLKKRSDLPQQLLEVVRSIEPRKIIDVPGIEEPLALFALRKYGISSQEDFEKLEEATKFVYSTELGRGSMIKDLHEKVPAAEGYEHLAKEISGASVQVARDRVREELLNRGDGRIVYEIINKPVYCRCGSEVVVKLLENQWFINYGDPRWKELAKKLLSSMKIVPEEARAQFLATIDWLRRRACARTRGLGVPLPWDPSWIIESLSDSTIYMAFYTVVNRIREAKLDPEKLSEEFWDYVLLGKGSSSDVARKLGVDESTVERIRREFDYWYPLDWRVSGKDLIPNHLTFFIFNHAAIFPESKWPRGIIANGWVLLKGGKMSKSRGNIVLLKDLVHTWGPDPTRLAMAIGAEVPQDFEITDDLMKTAISYIRRVYTLIKELREKCRNVSNGVADRWLVSKVFKLIDEAGKDLENVRIRSAAIKVFSQVAQAVEEYLSMVEAPSREVVEKISDAWVRSLAPFTPFIAEELWEQLGGESYVSLARWPEAREIDYEALLSVELASRVIEDVKSIARATKKERIRMVAIYAYPASVCSAVRVALSCSSVRDIGKALTEAGIPKDRAFKLAQRMIRVLRELDDEAKELLRNACIDEVEALKELSSYIAKKVGADRIEVYSALDAEAPDLGGKKGAAVPLKPGIYIE